ncbi:MAG TPA: hypothetical protein VMA09_20950 [Candidatus Binataceae bacterium]|nr:hypothetical protein [Candidatus Binataceae bacterium]
MKICHAAALGLMTWYLMLPSEAATPGAANAATTPVASVFGTYTNQGDCAKDRERFENDPVIGLRMRAAQCIQSSTDPSKTK